METKENTILQDEQRVHDMMLQLMKIRKEFVSNLGHPSNYLSDNAAMNLCQDIEEDFVSLSTELSHLYSYLIWKEANHV